MATTKVKGTSKKIKELRGEEIVDLKPENISEEQLKKIQDQVNRIFIFFFYYITNSMSTINFLTYSIMHSVLFIIFTYSDFSNQFAHLNYILFLQFQY